ncbi:MAG: DUF6599 family protein [Planctomycetota bacterium]|jgi:hypothetical protein
MARAGLLPKRAARRPSRTERRVGFVLLALLAGTVALFVLAGSRAGPPELPATAAAPAPAIFPLRSPGGWPRGEIERYVPDTLFEKIDGKADSYLAYDVVGLEFASYANPEHVDAFVDVYVYDMGLPLHAYGIYRAQRSGDEAHTPLGDEACAPGLALFARQGRFYVEVLASNESARDEGRVLAAALLSALPGAEEPVTDPPWFAREGLRIVRYDRRDCLMVEALRDAFLAIYADGSKALVARYPTPEDAEAAARAARESFAFLGEPARFAVVGRRVVGVAGTADAARLDALRQRLAREER